MKLITELRTDPADDLKDFGTLLKFAALVYEDEDEGDSMEFMPYNMDGSVSFYATREDADAAFEIALQGLKDSEDDFKEQGDEEGMLALFENPKGLMLLAATNMMGFRDNLDTAPHTMYDASMPHVTWERILYDMFDEEVP